MPDWIKFPIVLVIVTLISAVSLGFLQNLTEPARVAEAKAATDSALKIVLPDAKTFKQESKDIKGKKVDYYEGLNEAGEVIGYASVAGAAGYSSIIKVMVGVDKEFKVKAIKVLSQKETPGLGDKVNEVLSKKTLVGMAMGKKYDEKGLRPWFQIQFDGKETPVMVQKDGGTIDAITGATISSRAVCHAVNEAVASLKEVLR